MSQMARHPIEMIGKVRATGTSRHPSRAKHEVIEHQLALSIKKVGKRLLAAGSLEYIILLNLFPGQFTPLPAEFVAQPGKFFFFRKKLLARLNPFAVRYHLRQLRGR